ncbi:MAG: SRPBCC domain-containing protein, partial [bacterium]
TDSEGNVNNDMPRSKWEVNFTGEGKVTVVEIIITYDDLDQLDATLKMGFKEGLTMGMDNLDELLPTLRK